MTGHLLPNLARVFYHYASGIACERERILPHTLKIQHIPTLQHAITRESCGQQTLTATRKAPEETVSVFVQLWARGGEGHNRCAIWGVHAGPADPTNR